MKKTLCLLAVFVCCHNMCNASIEMNVDFHNNTKLTMKVYSSTGNYSVCDKKEETLVLGEDVECKINSLSIEPKTGILDTMSIMTVGDNDQSEIVKLIIHPDLVKFGSRLIEIDAKENIRYVDDAQVLEINGYVISVEAVKGGYRVSIKEIEKKPLKSAFVSLLGWFSRPFISMYNYFYTYSYC